MKPPNQRFESLRDVLIEELRDLHDAETQLVEALPKMIKAASDGYLKGAFTTHLGQTRVHVNRLDDILQRLGENASGGNCAGMKGLIEEGNAMIDAEGDDAVRDAGLIGAAQRVEQYEMAAYGAARALAEHLGEAPMAEILQATVDEEREAEEMLRDIAGSEISAHAMH